MKLMTHAFRLAATHFTQARHFSSPTSHITQDVDVLIAGGGLVGAALAAGIASHPLSCNLSITVVDPALSLSQSKALPRVPSLRASTISPSSQDFLMELGVWNHIPHESVAPFCDMLVWDRPRSLSMTEGKGPGTIHFKASDVPGAFQLGCVVDNDTLQRALYDRMSELSASHVNMAKATAESITFPYDLEDVVPQGYCDWPVVKLSNGESIRARLIVAADGARSQVRSMAGLDWFSHAYNEAAVVANVTLDRPIACAYQRFLSSGPLAILPVASSEEPLANVIWTTSVAEAEALMHVDSAAFVSEVNAALREEDHDGYESNFREDYFPLSTILKSRGIMRDSSGATEIYQLPFCKHVVGARGTFPLSLGHAPKYVDWKKRVVLMGDAAHNVHPFAGQGVNMGFADAQALTHAIARAAGTGRDLSGEDGAPLMQYERDRVSANVAMLASLHGLHEIFKLNAWAPFKIVRRLGISAIDNLTPLKKMIVRIIS